MIHKPSTELFPFTISGETADKIVQPWIWANENWLHEKHGNRFYTGVTEENHKKRGWKDIYLGNGYVKSFTWAHGEVLIHSESLVDIRTYGMWDDGSRGRLEHTFVDQYIKPERLIELIEARKMRIAEAMYEYDMRIKELQGIQNKYLELFGG